MQNGWVLRGLVGVAIATLTTSCDMVAALTSGEDPNADLPPCVDNVCTCGDFRTQADAQLVLDSFWADDYGLDGDGNGVACERLPDTAPTLDRATYFSNSPHLAFGNPSNAAQTNVNNYLIEKDEYALAYSAEKGTLLWAGWQLNFEWLGRTGRQDDFRPDGSLPKGVYQVTPRDYSGYDRGHMVPSADRTASRDVNSATFLMTNIFPQTAANNRGPWRELESYCRDLIYQQGKSLYILGGIYGQRERLAGDKISVPSRTWKVILVFDQPNPTAADLTERTEIIAVDMPNARRIDDQWQTYQTSVDRIELATGYDLLADVPEEIQVVVEARR
ncbi:MAG: DNA/RNA non-specific endonuclease [Cyanobacteria bacterium J06627_15]